MLGRPKIYNDLVSTHIKLERDVMNVVKEKGLNISEICRDALLSVLGNHALRQKYDKFSRIPVEVLKEVIELLDKDISLSRGARNIINKHTGIVATENEIIYWYERKADGYRGDG